MQAWFCPPSAIRCRPVCPPSEILLRVSPSAAALAPSPGLQLPVFLQLAAWRPGAGLVAEGRSRVGGGRSSINRGPLEPPTPLLLLATLGLLLRLPAHSSPPRRPPLQTAPAACRRLPTCVRTCSTARHQRRCLLACPPVSTVRHQRSGEPQVCVAHLAGRPHPQGWSRQGEWARLAGSDGRGAGPGCCRVNSAGQF